MHPSRSLYSPPPTPRLPLLIYFRNRLAIPFCDTHRHCQVQSHHQSVQIRCSHYGWEISSLDARGRNGSLAFPSTPFTKLILSSLETCVSQTLERQAQSAGPLGVRDLSRAHSVGGEGGDDRPAGLIREGSRVPIPF